MKVKKVWLPEEAQVLSCMYEVDLETKESAMWSPYTIWIKHREKGEEKEFDKAFNKLKAKMKKVAFKGDWKNITL